MRKKLNLIFYYKKKNRYGFNAIAGSVESLPELNHYINLYFPEDKIKLFKLLSEFQNYNNVDTLVLFSFFSTQKIEFYELPKEIKSRWGDRIKTIAGGPHPSGATLETLENGFDYVLRGEGEQSFRDFLFSFLNNEDRKIKGISFIKDGKYINWGKGERVDLNLFPPFSLEYEKFGPIEITRGCPFVCYYCQTPQLFGAKVRHRNIENILKYVEVLKKRGMRDIRFISPNAFSYGSEDGKRINYDAIENLLKELRNLLGRNGRIFFGTFPSEVRPEHIDELTLSFLKKYSDNRRIVVGAQTGSEKLLKKIHRGHTVEDVRKAVIKAKKFGFSVDVDFIFGLPYEDENDVKESISLMEELISYGSRIHAHTFMPLPQTPFSKAQSGKIPDKIKNFLNIHLPKGKIFGDWREQEKLGELIKS